MSPSVQGAFCAQRQQDPVGNEITVSGRALYEKRILSPNGYGGPRTQPVSYAAVFVLDLNNEVVTSGYTDGNGRFRLVITRDGGNEYFVAVATGANNERHTLSVRDCPQSEDASQCNVYAIGSPTFRRIATSIAET